MARLRDPEPAAMLAQPVPAPEIRAATVIELVRLDRQHIADPPRFDEFAGLDVDRCEPEIEPDERLSARPLVGRHNRLTLRGRHFQRFFDKNELARVQRRQIRVVHAATIGKIAQSPKTRQTPEVDTLLAEQTP